MTKLENQLKSYIEWCKNQSLKANDYNSLKRYIQEVA